MAGRRIGIYEAEHFFHSSALLLFVLVNWQGGLLNTVLVSLTFPLLFGTSFTSLQTLKFYSPAGLTFSVLLSV